MLSFWNYKVYWKHFETLSLLTTTSGIWSKCKQGTVKNSWNHFDVRGDKCHHNLSLFAQTSRSTPTITLGDMFPLHINTSVAVTVAHNWTTIHQQTIDTSSANNVYIKFYLLFRGETTPNGTATFLHLHTHHMMDMVDKHGDGQSLPITGINT